jgi:uncharacterized protein YciI
MRRAPLLAALALAAALPGLAVAADPPAFQMESFQLVLLMRAPTWRKLPQAEAEELQARHIAHLTAMGESGKMPIAGPFSSQADPAYRGACIYRVATPEEARALAEQDPIVKAGQLRVEVMTWWVGKDHLAFPRAPVAR